jgi:hypothetical protein
MPTADFFRGFGLFVVESFFDRDLCSRLRADLHAGVSSAATVGSHGAEFVVDRDVRRVTQARINDASTALVKTRLMGLIYKLFDDPVGRSIGFPLEADEGLLIGFRSDLPHSVARVTHGDRYTIASWYI